MRRLIVALCLLPAAARAEDKPVVDGLAREGTNDFKVRLEHAVQDLTSFAMRPWDLILQPLLDGKYRYRGVGFDAVITAEGKVEFREKGAVQLRLAQLLDKHMQPSNKVVPALSIGNIDDFFAQLAGADPHASERRTFLTKTKALREQLQEAAAQRILDRAHAELAQQLTRIANEADRMGRGRAQDALFALWDRNSDDGVGDEARTYIERFIREHCDGACEFDAPALARLNAKRKSKRAFEPYAAK